jgi:hypothetical protein
MMIECKISGSVVDHSERHLLFTIMVMGRLGT